MAGVIALALLLLGCADPALARYREALDAYGEGRAALAAGKTADAAAAFGRVAERDPDSATAVGWRAWALDQGGDDAGALAVLDEGLARFPSDPNLRYNRAALRARSGALDGAAEDLRVLYASGALDPAEAGDDPDFAALARDPATVALAPPPAVEVSAHGEAGAVLLGDASHDGGAAGTGADLAFDDGHALAGGGQ